MFGRECLSQLLLPHPRDRVKAGRSMKQEGLGFPIPFTDHHLRRQPPAHVCVCVTPCVSLPTYVCLCTRACLSVCVNARVHVLMCLCGGWSACEHTFVSVRCVCVRVCDFILISSFALCICSNVHGASEIH